MSGRSTSTTAAAGCSVGIASIADLPRSTATGVHPCCSTRRESRTSNSWLSSTSRILAPMGWRRYRHLAGRSTFGGGSARGVVPARGRVGMVRRRLHASPKEAPMRPIRALALFAATLAAVACEKKPTAQPPPASAGAAAVVGDVIVLGHVGSLTGNEATFGDSTDKGLKLAIEEANAKGGVKGKLIELKTYDDQGKPEEAAVAATRLLVNDRASIDRKSTRLNSSHQLISYAVFCLK